METGSREAGQLSVVPRVGALLPVPAPKPKPERNRRWTRRLFVAGAMLAAMAPAFGAWRYFIEPPTVAVARPSRGLAIEAVYATGVIEPIDYARFGATVAGRVTELLVDEGDSVKKGQIVARLDARQPRARLQDAKARLTMAEADIARNQTVMNRGVLAVQTLERSQQERDQAAAAVDLFARQLEDYSVLSPLDGTVMKRNVEPGETVAANAVMFEISSTARKRIAADVDERDIADVKLGAALAARADGFPDEAFQANVTNIRRQGDTGSRTFRVEADLPSDTKLMIGMTVDVDIVVNQTPDALLVPAGAVAHGPSQGVFVVDHARARRVDVKTGAVGTTKVEILAGLKEGDSVILDPSYRLKDGQAVRAAP